MRTYNKLNMKRNLATIANSGRLNAASSAPLQRPLILEDVKGDRSHLPMFTISREHGFLPRKDPMVRLPDQFGAVEQLLNDMTIHQKSGGIGLLGLGQFGDAVKSTLGPLDMMKHVEQAIKSNDQHLLSALFRDYCFLTSAYLLEPVDRSFRATGKYGQGRDVLPACLAVPLSALADKLGQFPFMEYATSYALANYRRIQCADPNKHLPMSSWDLDNLTTIRNFESVDGSETGFIAVHVAMVAYTGQVVTATEDIMAAVEHNDRAAFNKSMRDLYKTYRAINGVMEKMWAESRPRDYNRIRSFIFGTAPGNKLNSMFPKGVIYEGVSEQPTHYRGESGANDSIIPVLDNLLQITQRLPKNELTETLREFRSYRPSAQRTYLEYLERRSVDLGIANFARETPESLALYTLLVHENVDFRARHWNFTMSYIIKYTDYQIATGGSPILKYLPHNLRVALEVLEDSCAALPERAALESILADDELSADVEAVRKRAKTQRRLLDRQVEELTSQVKGKDDKRVFADGQRPIFGDSSKWTRGSVGSDGIG